MKRILVLFLALLPLLIFAQGYSEEFGIPGESVPADDAEYPDGTELGMNGAVGTVMINNEIYSQVRLMPQINFGKFGLGLDVDLLIDSEGNIRKEDWDEWQDYVNKIYYISWGRRKDPFYFKVGCIPDYTLGHGLIFNRYSNMLLYPGVKNVGGYVGINTPISGLGFEAFTHNVHKNEILAGRVFINPVQLLEIPLFERLQVGVNLGIDRDQYRRFEDRDNDGIPDIYDRFPNDGAYWLDTDNDGIPDNIDLDINGNGFIDHPSINPYVDAQFPNIANEYSSYPFDQTAVSDLLQAFPKRDDVTVYSADYRIPLIETDLFMLDNYGEIAKIDGYGTGVIFPGFSSKFFIFDAKFEFRNFGAKFLPGYFDRLYDQQRSYVLYNNRPSDGRNEWSLATKESMLDGVAASVGWFGHLRANFYDIVNLKVAFQDMYGEGNHMGKSLWGSLTVNPTFVPNLKEATMSYSQVNVNYIDLRYPRNFNSIVTGRLVYGLSDTTNLVGKYNEVYIDLDGDGKIKGKDEVIESFAFGVEFSF